MSNEARVYSSLTLKVGNLDWQSRPTSFLADVSGSNGPTPGAMVATVNGVDVNLSELTAFGGFCRIMNYDAANKVRVGVKDTITGVFYPMMLLKAGEFYQFRLDEDLQKQEAGTGTFAGTTARLHVKAVGGACYVTVEAFDP